VKVKRQVAAYFLLHVVKRQKQLNKDDMAIGVFGHILSFYGIWFLPLDGVRCYGDVAVCVSVTLMNCAQTTESIIMRFSPACSAAILVFPRQI